MEFDILLKIILIDLVMSGDNAVIIALAAKNVAKEQQKKAIFIGTFGAIALRLGLAFVVVHLLAIPYLQFIGGLLLIWIAFKLLLSNDDHSNMKSGNSLFDAVKIIIIADFVMSLDNVIAIAGAADGHFGMILLGIVISIPIIIWGSQMIIKAMEKFPIIIYIGAGVLTWTSAEMMTKDKKIAPLVENLPISQNVLHYALPILLTVVTLGICYIINRSKQKKEA